MPSWKNRPIAQPSFPLDAGWSDIGAWSALWEISAQDERGNVLQGDVFATPRRTRGSSPSTACATTVGVGQRVVIETPDAVLVMHKDRPSTSRQVVKRLKSDNRRNTTPIGASIVRGGLRGVDAGHRFQVKRLTIKPGAALSLQLHHQRAEHWVVVKGHARVTRGDDEVWSWRRTSQPISPIGTKHRLENIGDAPLEIIEVQSGSYLGEDDIVRFEDIYNRHV